MTSVMLDPMDSSKAIIGSATDFLIGAEQGASVISNVHRDVVCEGQGCVIHHPSNHHMRDWPLTWRNDKGVMERRCPHGVGHPDPDDAAYLVSVSRAFDTVHGCDGCCHG